jgi:hypothetical protein
MDRSSHGRGIPFGVGLGYRVFLAELRYRTMSVPRPECQIADLQKKCTRKFLLRPKGKPAFVLVPFFIARDSRGSTTDCYFDLRELGLFIRAVSGWLILYLVWLLTQGSTSVVNLYVNFVICRLLQMSNGSASGCLCVKQNLPRTRKRIRRIIRPGFRVIRVWRVAVVLVVSLL